MLSSAETAAAPLPGIAMTMLLGSRGGLYLQLSQLSRKVPTIIVTRSLQAARHASISIISKDEIVRDDVVSEA